MITRDNWLDVKQFLAHYARIGKDPETVKRIRGLMRHLLEWADGTPFPKARTIDPAYPSYLLTARADGKAVPLSAASMKKACEYARVFFNWMRGEHLARYRNLTASWIDTIRPSLSKGMQSEYREHQFWEIEQVRKIAALEPRTLTEERDRAAVCFMFLSAMRVQAFVSLPVQAVDLFKFKVSQFPKLGVQTKYRKAEKTGLIQLPDLLSVVRDWDAKVRNAGVPLWYPRIDRWHRGFCQERDFDFVTRRAVLNAGIRNLCARAGVEYLSSHKLRHGHTVYMMRRIKDIKSLKTLSQNLMHSSIEITDGIYGRLAGDDIGDLYAGTAED